MAGEHTVTGIQANAHQQIRRWADIVAERPSEPWAPEEEALGDEEDCDEEDVSPKSVAGRRRRRRRHGRKTGSADSVETRSDVGKALCETKTVVTWSDLGLSGGEHVLQKAMHNEGSRNDTENLSFRVGAPRGVVGNHQVATVAWSQFQPQEPAAVAAWPVDATRSWATPQLHGIPYHHNVMVGNAQDTACDDGNRRVSGGWSEGHAHELRRWLCASFPGNSGSLDTSPKELADMLRGVSQQAYED
eukprot:CAMPEP_0177194686 /NCGR_PEP_ID=MMETSP0367-20130122/23104_1 /TAXON_ID=447022 ORGANISM="Scrippsiella hangoei-like, Strain SHHI-4" /NCGR_SAMPLE_ID=MMETSP0367 /ASSEMBLY_ACC=CAM_ASM_000362 /LENGTH=245 /DNA_ID=CAMNT_0018642647 /DNA_START=102 /DNA_END=839 /DNA_ORIENTATION=+